jgi:PAS domain-containing protein
LIPTSDHQGRVRARIRENVPVKQKEEKLEHFLQVLIDAIPVPIFYKDMQGRYLGCNREFERYIGLTQG